MSKKSLSVKSVSILLVLVLLLGLAAGGTVAWLADQSDSVVNTFTYGDINIKLEETNTNKDTDGDDTTNLYTMIPGEIIVKDPILTVEANSEKCWLFVELVEAGGAKIFDDQNQVIASYGFDDYLEYTMDKVDDTDPAEEVWTALPGVEGVYYRVVEKNETKAQTFMVLENNHVTVKDGVTKDMVNALDNGADPDAALPTLTITGYAVQYSATDDVAEAWALAGTKGVPAP